MYINNSQIKNNNIFNSDVSIKLGVSIEFDDYYTVLSLVRVR